MSVRRLEAGDRTWLREALRDGWGDDAMAGHGELFLPADHEGFVSGDHAGVVTYRIDGDACEITLIESFEQGRGVGTELLDTVVGEARSAGCSRVWLVTTNDNVHAQRWYAARGFVVTEVRRGAVEEYRRTLKQTIPEVGRDGVPITDEVELSLDL